MPSGQAVFTNSSGFVQVQVFFTTSDVTDCPTFVLQWSLVLGAQCVGWFVIHMDVMCLCRHFPVVQRDLLHRELPALGVCGWSRWVLQCSLLAVCLAGGLLWPIPSSVGSQDGTHVYLPGHTWSSSRFTDRCETRYI